MLKRIFAILLCSGILSLPVTGADRPYLAAARQAARWIEASSVQTADGEVWPADPRDPKSVGETLYSGVPGVVLFFLEGYRYTGDESYLKQAKAGADHLLAEVSNQEGTGLYEGIAGTGFVLFETYKVTHDSKYKEGAEKCVARIKAEAKPVEDGVEWNDVTDIIAGASGTGVFLLYAAREMNDPSCVDLAAKAGEHLIGLGKAEKGGLKWAMDSKFPRLMPNFSHGTAGVCYFLASLYQKTHRKEFLRTALEGARYLTTVANKDTCLIFHHEPGGADLYYLGFCHGPVGTTRLYYRLYQVTGDRKWMDWVEKSANGIMTSGIPANLTPGYWNNISQCCGTTGIAEFCLTLYRITHKQKYLDFSKKMTANLLSRATTDDKGMRWIQAENRVSPEVVIAQTGYMQGAAGVGMFLLHLDGFYHGKNDPIKFPDNPF